MKKVVYIFLGLIVIGLLYLGYINKFFTTIKTYDDCVNAGGKIYNAMTPHCEIYGLNYSGLTSEEFPNFNR